MGDAVAFISQMLTFILIVMFTTAGIAIAGLIWAMRSMRDIRVPPGADFFTTLHYVPLTLVVLLDLLDLGLDIFSTPIAWIVLDRLGLPNLRNTAALQGIIPATGPVPVLTIAWLLTRMLNLGYPPGAHRPYPAQVVEYLEDPYYDDYYDERPRPRRRANVIEGDAEEV